MPALDSNAIAEAIAVLAADPVRRDRLAEAGRRRVEEHFSIDRMIADYRSIYDSFGSR